MVARSGVEIRTEVQRIVQEQVGELVTELNARQATVSARFENIEQKLNGADQMIRILDSAVMARLGALEDHAKEINTRVQQAEDRIPAEQQRMILLETAVEEIAQNQAKVIGDTQQSTTRLMRDMQHAVGELRRHDTVFGEADRCLNNLNQRFTELEEKVKTSDTNRQGGKSLIDPRLINVPVFNGKNQKDFTDWRDLIEKMSNPIYPGIKTVLKKIRRLKTTITPEVFQEIKHDMELDGVYIRWEFTQVNDEFGTYLLTKLDGKPKTDAESVSRHGGMEMFRLLHQKFDQVSSDAEGLLTAEITQLSASPAKTLRELANKVTELEARAQAYRERLSKSPDDTLLGSVLTAILDPQTRREFVNTGGLIGRYEKMKSIIEELE